MKLGLKSLTWNMFTTCGFVTAMAFSVMHPPFLQSRHAFSGIGHPHSDILNNGETRHRTVVPKTQIDAVTSKRTRILHLCPKELDALVGCECMRRIMCSEQSCSKHSDWCNSIEINPDLASLPKTMGRECMSHSMLHAEEEDTTPQIMRQRRLWWLRLFGLLLVIHI